MVFVSWLRLGSWKIHISIISTFAQLHSFLNDMPYYAHNAERDEDHRPVAVPGDMNDAKVRQPDQGTDYDQKDAVENRMEPEFHFFLLCFRMPTASSTDIFP